MIDYVELAGEIAAWMQNYVQQAGLTGYVVGLSGGIDSAVTAALALRAVGPANVLGVIMPIHSLPEDAAYAESLAAALGLEALTVDLTPTFDRLVAELPPGTPMALANVKPRLRMATLYYLAQSRGALVAGTGNRPEMMVGYFTKYGDGGVDLEPLGALYKHEIRALARVLGVPTPIIERPPSAGLWPGQTDEAELGITYAELDAILAAWEAGEEPDAPAETLARVKRMVAATAHKRTPPPLFEIRR